MKKTALTFIILGTLVCMALNARNNDNISPDQKLRLAAAVIENYYVEEVNTDTLVDEAIIAMLRTLDPHSAYSTPEETRELNHR